MAKSATPTSRRYGLAALKLRADGAGLRIAPPSRGARSGSGGAGRREGRLGSPTPRTEQTWQAAPPLSPSPSQCRFPCSLGPWRSSWALGDQRWPCLQGLPAQGSRGGVNKHRCLQHAAQPGRLPGGNDGWPTCLEQQTDGVGWENEGEEPAHAPGCLRAAGPGSPAAPVSNSRRLIAAPPARGRLGCVGGPRVGEAVTA